MMHTLIVYAHPEPTSFSGALKDRAVEALTGAGRTAAVSDLYGDRFDPVAGRHDFPSVADPARFHYQTEQDLAARSGSFAPDIAREQARVGDADVLILVFPLWWGAPPAILKGWFERVLSYGFGYVDGRRFDTGLFKGRRALVAVTTGGTPERFSPDGVYGEIGQILYPVNRLLLQYMGFEVLPPFVAYAAPRVSGAERDAYLDAWTRRVVEATDGRVTRDATATADTGRAAWTRPA